MHQHLGDALVLFSFFGNGPAGAGWVSIVKIEGDEKSEMFFQLEQRVRRKKRRNQKTNPNVGKVRDSCFLFVG